MSCNRSPVRKLGFCLLATVVMILCRTITVAQTAIEGATSATIGQCPSQSADEDNASVPAAATKAGCFVDHGFKGTDGGLPTAALLEDRAGNLYGTASSGGSGFGVVFKLDTAHHESVLHAFTGPDGRIPHGSLVSDRFGNLYGTTSFGGASDLGTVFKIDPYGRETVLHSFSGSPDGRNPYAGLVMDVAGNLYGTTEFGGTSDLGTIFEIDALGRQRVLHSFAGGSTDGSNPKAGLTVDGEGKLYGTTFAGGSDGKGTVFEFDSKQDTEDVLYNFSGGSDGGNPLGGITRASDGTLYGTAGFGGLPGKKRYGCCKPPARVGYDDTLVKKRYGCCKPPAHVGYDDTLVKKRYGCCKPPARAGVVFSLTGTRQNVLYTFTGGVDGGVPSGDLVLSNGVLYGTTQLGGPGQRGTAFSLNLADGSETVLHGFTGKADGGTPQAGLSMNAAGVLYGTTSAGGSVMKGTVFHLQNLSSRK